MNDETIEHKSLLDDVDKAYMNWLLHDITYVVLKDGSTLIVNNVGYLYEPEQLQVMEKEIKLLQQAIANYRIFLSAATPGIATEANKAREERFSKEHSKRYDGRLIK